MYGLIDRLLSGSGRNTIALRLITMKMFSIVLMLGAPLWKGGIGVWFVQKT